MTTETDLRIRIRSDLAISGPSTTNDIARRIEADHWDVQHEICRMHMADLVVQPGKIEVPGRGTRPVWALVRTN